ncbi:MAG: hypothetical protein ACXVPN_07440 [Bacteroidia bacterium]
MKKFFSKIADRQQTIIHLTLIILVMATFVFLGVRLVSGHCLSESYNLGDKGTLGDAVNGLSAPFISFFSAILIYITFREQVKANKLLQSQWQIDTFLKVFNDMNEKTKNFNAKLPSGSYDFEGQTIFDEYNGIGIADYIIMIYGSYEKGAPSELTDLIYVIDELTFLCELVNESPENRKEFMRQKVIRFYFSGFHSAIFRLKKNLPKNDPPYKPFWNATEKLHGQIEKISTVGDLLSANGEGQEHEDLTNRC